MATWRQGRMGGIRTVVDRTGTCLQAGREGRGLNGQKTCLPLLPFPLLLPQPKQTLACRQVEGEAADLSLPNGEGQGEEGEKGEDLEDQGVGQAKPSL